MKRVSIGFDLGVASCGWSIVDCETKEILDYGVKIFKKSEKAEERRKHRGLRRRYSRQAHRIERFELLLEQKNLKLEVGTFHNLYEIKEKALEEKIDLTQLLTIMNTSLRKRGYIPFGEDTRENKYVDKYPKLYPCQIQKIILEENGKYRGTEYPFLVEDIKRELQVILKKQSEFHEFLDDDFIAKYFEIFESKRKFWQGPGGKKENQLTPFGRFKTKEDLVNVDDKKLLYEDLIKGCSIYLNERSAVTSNFYAQYFNFYNDLINVRISQDSGLDEKLFSLQNDGSYKFKTLSIEMFLEELLTAKSISVKNILKKLFKIELANVSGLRINAKGEVEITKFELIKELIKQAKEFKVEFDWRNVEDIEIINDIVEFVTLVPKGSYVEMAEFYKIEEYVLKISEQKTFLNKIENKYHSYSERALKTFIELMKNTEKNSMQVLKDNEEQIKPEVEKIKIENYFKTQKFEMSFEFIDEIIASPQVKKTLKVATVTYNQIKKECQKKNYKITHVCVESNSDILFDTNKKKYNEYMNQLEGNFSKREKYRKEGITDEKIIDKKLLLEETAHACIYCGIHLTEDTMEIDHILPISKSADDSFANKISSCHKCNNDKKNESAYRFVQNQLDFKKYEERVKKISIEQKKMNLLYSDDLNKYDRKFIARNLRDTAYATKEFTRQLKYFAKALELKGIDETIHVVSMPPAITAQVRRNLQEEKNRNFDCHHAFDASICAYFPLTRIGELATIIANESASFWKSDNYRKILGESITKNKFVISPESNFVKCLKKISNENTRFHFEVRKNANGQLWNADINKVLITEGKKGKKEYQKVEYISNIYDAELKKIEKLFSEKSSEILGIKKNDPQAYETLKKIIEEYKGKKYIDRNGDETKEVNPFKHYCLEQNDNLPVSEFNPNVHGIKLISKKGKERPAIIRLNYTKKVNLPYIMKKKNSNQKETRHVMRDSMNALCTEVYRNLDKKEFLYLPIYSVSTNLKTNEINRNDSYYKEVYEHFIGKAKVEYVCSLYTNMYIKAIKADGTKVEGLFSYFDKSTKFLQIKSKAGKRGEVLGKGIESLEIINIYGLGAKGLNHQ
ncbi:MAG: type II CRISPR RNA-guided endonuclease Cas9 [Mycoplasmatales bacterium]